MTKIANIPLIDIQKFSRDAQELRGTNPLTDFSRVCEDVPPGCDISATQVGWQAYGFWRSVLGQVVTAQQSESMGQPWLRLTIETEVPRLCQRCLQPFVLPVSVDRPFRFVADEDAAVAEDEDSEEDVLVWSKDFDLHALLEDEILLDLPLIPMHDECAAPGGFNLPAADEEGDAKGDVRQPFADLASLMKKGKG